MPSYAPDIDLLTVARLYTQQVHGAVHKRAAEALNVDYHMFRRFLHGGRASPENRQKIKSGLQAVDFDSAKDRKIAYEISVDVTRSMLTQLLQALDAYQSTAPRPLVSQND